MYLLVQIDQGGYIRTADPARSIVHRETTGLQYKHVVNRILADAKEGMSREDHALLELNEDGGGHRIWMRDDQRELLMPRLSLWKTCYGEWQIMKLNGEE